MRIFSSTLLLILFTGAGAAAGTLVRRRHPDITLENALRKARGLYLVLAAAVAVFAASMVMLVLQTARPSLLWSLPLWVDLHMNAVLWNALGALFAYLFAFASTVAVATVHAERWKIVLASVLALLALQFVQWYYSRPLAPLLGEEVAAEGMILQSHPSSCGAAAAATAARAVGMEVTEKGMAEAMGTTVIGTSAAEIIVGIQRLGLGARKVQVSRDRLEEVRPPAILFFGHPLGRSEEHAVAYLEMRSGRARIWDPGTGKLRILAPSYLPAVWEGRAIEIFAKEGK